MERSYIAVIQAGGKGTRMHELTNDKIPKPLLKIDGRPMIEWQILQLKEFGIDSFILIIGHLGEKIEEYFGNGSKWNVRITYVKENKPLGSAGAFYHIKKYVKDKDVILVFGDVMFEIDWNRFIRFHEEKKGMVTLLAHPNSHPYDSDLLILGEKDRVERIDSKNNVRNYNYKNCVNAGLSIFRGELLEYITEEKNIDFESELVEPLIKSGKVFAYNTPEYVKDAGTPERFYSVSKEKQEKVWESKCLKNKQKAVFLDRDGTINVYKGLLRKSEDFELYKGVANAIKELNKSTYLAIVATNQPVIARGECTFEELDNIHMKMETELGKEGAFVNDIFFCPHHPDKGFAGEISELKIECNCRKPKIGMFLEASEKYNIDLKKSWFIGDTTMDIQAGKNANMRTILVKTGEAGKDHKYSVKPDYEATDLLSAVRIILNKKSEEK